jgi:CHAD domain-containing protein
MGKTGNMKWEPRAGPAANARRELPRMISAYFSVVREFLADDHAPRKLHQLRLASKRVRYTLELFRPCYPAGFEDRLDALKKLQDWLGEVNDAVASERLFHDALKRQPKVRKFLQDRAADQASKFIHHWKETFDAPGREAWWTEFLSKPVAPRPRVSSSKKRKRVT